MGALEAEIFQAQRLPKRTEGSALHHSGNGTEAENRTWSKDDWLVLKCIGRGAYGAIYVAYDHTTDENEHFPTHCCALRAISAAHADKLHVLKSTAELMRHYPSRFLTHYYGSFDDADGYIFFVHELCQGGELMQHYRHTGKEGVSGTLPVRDAAFYVAQLVLALDHLHKNRIVYRDLRPENILLGRDGNVRLCSNYLSRRVRGAAFTICGSPEYAAPEVFHGEGYSFPVDWWGLGICLYEFLEGFPPFTSESPARTIELAAAPDPYFPPLFDATAKKLVLALLVADPASRMGASKGIACFKKHAFFSEVNWEAMVVGGVDPPISPALPTPDDCRFFELHPPLEDVPSPFQGF